MSKVNNTCQSCGMPLSKDPAQGGSEKDGSKSLKYCSYCYSEGAFLFEGDIKEFQENTRLKMIESGNSKFIAWLFTRGVSRLERWKK